MVRQRVASAARRTARGAIAVGNTKSADRRSGHQLVRDLRPPAGHVEVGEHVRRPHEGLAQRLVGLRGVRDLAQRHGVVAGPHDPGAGPVRHQPEVRTVEHDALTLLDHVQVEVARAGQAEEVAGDRERDARAGGPVAAQQPEGDDQRGDVLGPGEPDDVVRGVLADDRVTGVVEAGRAGEPG